jgi:hypothetical protein
MGSNVQKDRLGISKVAGQVAECGWFFREQPPPDEGIDAQIEGADEDGRPNARLVGVQVKSGPSYFESKTEEGWRFWVRRKTFGYWQRSPLPVIVVLYEPESDTAYWQEATPATATRTADGNYTIVVPHDHVLGPDTLDDLEALANRGLPAEAEEQEVALELRRADADVSWLELLSDGNRLFLEIEEWVNKTSGRVSLRLVAEDESGSESFEREWPWAFIPGASLAEQLPKVFPWADLSVDESHYREEAYVDYVNECGIWASEEDTYWFGEDFDTWYAARDAQGLRPYGEAGGGEVALWRLQLKLNELGSQTLERVHSAEWTDTLLQMDAEDAAAQARLEGYYEGQYGDLPIGRSVERIVFFSGDDADVVAADEVLWTDTDTRSKTAEPILEHALGRSSTEALLEAFVKRFASNLDDKGQGWVINYREIQSWLHELGYRS